MIPLCGCSVSYPTISDVGCAAFDTSEGACQRQFVPLHSGSIPMSMAIEFAIAKTNKYASRESGDTAELIERPGGGFSAVTVDGQGSGAGAKSLSLMLTSKAVALLKEGVRDGAVARAVHDVLFAYRQGRVSASLDIVSVDLTTKSVVITRNGDAPILVQEEGAWRSLPSAAGPIGQYHFTRPAVTHVHAHPGLVVCTVTDGVALSGTAFGREGFNVASFANRRLAGEGRAKATAEAILQEAIERDDGRPRDDMTVVALALRAHQDTTLVRTIDLYAPLP